MMVTPLISMGVTKIANSNVAMESLKATKNAMMATRPT